MSKNTIKGKVTRIIDGCTFDMLIAENNSEINCKDLETVLDRNELPFIFV